LRRIDPGLLIAGLALTGLTSYTIMWLSKVPVPWLNVPLWLVLTLGGTPLVWELLGKAMRREFGSDLLAGISILTSVVLGEYLAGSIVVLMLSGGEALESFAVARASAVLDALARRMPTLAHRREGTELRDIQVADIQVGDLLAVHPHEICPVDGEVIEGRGQMDEAYLTGEPFLNPKTPGSKVLSGAVNGDFMLIIQATHRAVDSRYARIMEVMKESEQRRPRLRRLGDQLGAYYTPLAVAIALASWGLSGEPVRFLAVLVVATPCPLLIAIPVAIIGSISRAARRGIIVRNPAVMEQLDLVETMIMDKTGTLTYGQPALTDQTMFNGFEAREVLRLVACLERYSRHPLAGAIVGQARAENLPLAEASSISEPPGQGLIGEIEGHKLQVTNRKVAARFQAELPPGAGLECVVLVDDKLAAHYRFRDKPRDESRLFVQHLGPRHHIKRSLIVSGDREEEVRYLAEQVGVAEVYAGQSPEQKLAIVREETSKARTVYLGDGINDGPALMAATVGIAIGQASDITEEAAGAVILDGSLVKVDEFLHISSNLRAVALQSAVGGMALSILGMLAASLGYLPPVAGALTQEVIDLAAVLNALRTALPPARPTDYEQGA
jgi:heavy metal translocating P-type ATPase